MIYKHLTSAAAAIVMTAATFGGINGYAGHIVSADRAASLQTVASMQIDTSLQQALRKAEHEVRNNVVDNVAGLLPPIAIELPTVMVVAHRHTSSL